MTVFNKNKIDFTKEKIFFGEQLNTQRFDEFKYPIFDKLTQRQLGFFWRPEEVSLQKDRSDYQLLTPAQKHIFTSMQLSKFVVLSSPISRLWNSNRYIYYIF